MSYAALCKIHAFKKKKIEYLIFYAFYRWQDTPARHRAIPGRRGLARGCWLAGCPGRSWIPWWPCLLPAPWCRPWGCIHTTVSAKRWEAEIGVTWWENRCVEQTVDFIGACYKSSELIPITHLALRTLDVSWVQKDSSVHQSTVNVGHHWPDVSAAIWSRTILETQKWNVSISLSFSESHIFCIMSSNDQWPLFRIMSFARVQQLIFCYLWVLLLL